MSTEIRDFLSRISGERLSIGKFLGLTPYSGRGLAGAGNFLGIISWEYIRTYYKEFLVTHSKEFLLTHSKEFLVIHSQEFLVTHSQEFLITLSKELLITLSEEFLVTNSWEFLWKITRENVNQIWGNSWDFTDKNSSDPIPGNFLELFPRFSKRNIFSGYLNSLIRT